MPFGLLILIATSFSYMTWWFQSSWGDFFIPAGLDVTLVWTIIRLTCLKRGIWPNLNPSSKSLSNWISWNHLLKVLIIPSFIFIHFRRSRAWTTRSTKPWRRSTRWRSSASSSWASPRSRSSSSTSGSSLSQEVTSRDDFYIICVDWQPLAQSRSHPWSIFSGSSPIWASGWVIRSP